MNNEALDVIVAAMKKQGADDDAVLLVRFAFDALPNMAKDLNRIANSLEDIELNTRRMT